MITLFKKDATNFESNGLGSLDQNIINPEISWVDNGAFTLEFKYPLFSKHGKEIENSSIIKANDAEGSNLFFVYKVTPSMGVVHVLCYQISYKLAFNSINDTFIVEKNGQMALNQLSNSTQYSHQFKFFSDIQTAASSRVVRKNPIEFLLDTSLDNCFLNRWGGHIVRQNFNISMNNSYGSNKGYTIRHKKDLKGYEAEFDESTVITRIRPLGYDGLLLPELYVDSPLTNSYPEPRIQQKEYSNVKVAEKAGDEGFATKELAYAELRRLAKLEFSKNKVDIPDFSAKVSFVNLKDTDEYKDLKSLKQILAGDTVKVIHSQDNFNIEAQMVEYKWNPLNQSYISITLGNYTKSFTSTVSKVSSLQTNLSQIAQQAQSAWSAANGKNTVYSLTYKPAITGSSVEGDLLYLKNGDKIEMWILEKVNGELQWVLQVSDATSEELKAQIAQAKADIDEAVDSANAAVDKANANVQAIEANTQLIDDVNTIANTAKSQAQTAVTNAQTAVSNAGTAMSNSQAAITDAQNALDSYNNMVIGGVNILVTTTDEKIFKGNGAENQQAILSLLTKNSLADYGLKVGDKVSFSATCEISGSGFSGILTPRLRTSWTNLTKDYKAYTITKAEKIYFKSTFTMTEDRLANGTGVDFRADNVPSSVSMKWSEIQLEVGDKTTGYAPAPDEISVEITNINGQLRQKVSQKNFDTLNGTVANQSTQISQNKTDIASKANQTTVNTLTGRVSTAETNINQNAQDIVLKASKTAVDTLTGRVSTAEGSISTMAGKIALKANQTSVNKITGKVSSLESSFTVQSGQISALNTKTDGQTTKIGSLQSSYDGLTSTVASVENSLQQNNLVYNATLQGGSDGWELHNGYTQSSYRDINGNYIINFSLASNENSTWYFARSKQVPIGNYKTFSYAASLMRRTDIANSGVFALSIEGFDSTGKRIEYKSTNYDYQLIDDWWKVVSDSYTFTNPDVKTVCFTLATNGFGHYIACQPILVADSKVGSFVPDRVDKSQVTQLTQNLDGFKTTVSNTYLSKSDASGTYADKVSVASQITQSATSVTSNVQSWTNNKLTAYSTTQQTSTSITNAVASKADKSQITQLSDQITSTVTGLTEDSMVTVDMIKGAKTKHPNYPDMIVLGIPATSGETYIVSTNKPNRGTKSAPIADIFYTQALNAPPSIPSNGAWSGHSVTTKAVINRIYLVFRNANFLNSFANGEYWVKVIAAPASQSQITQLSDNINLRVSKGDVVSQINLEAGKALISANQILLNADNVKFSGSAFIPSAFIQNLTADKINTGTLNAGNINVINLNALSITTGTLNAHRIGANSITADKIKATSLDLFSNDRYTNVRSDGMRIQGKAQIVFGNWRDSSNTLRTTQGVYIGGIGGGTKHMAFTRSNGSTFMLRAENGMDYGTNQNVSLNQLNIYDNVQFWESARVHGNLINEGYIAMGGGIQEASIQYDKNAATMNFRIPGGRSGSYYWFNQKVTSAGSFDSASRLSLKNVKGNYQGSALDDICKTDIVEYSYKNSPEDKQLSPIIDDVNTDKQYHLPDVITDGKTVNLYAMTSLSWLAIKELNKKIEQLEQKLKEK